ncbi:MULTISPECIES: DUF4256 domain-containing protein [unclassified Sphingobacterium]|uniref:DUF4256 domain-containing protein n=1 Tax=unclassified Sphingobacterium TaxID=2609468 RepID=UPI0025D26183|nr:MULTISPECIES: DUF4256 domain-containing protein [unclassified Sphingobacterium]
MKNSIAPEDQSLLLETLEKRFNKFTNRHPQISWNEVADKLRDNPQKLWSLHQMEKSAGEPDIVIIDPETKVYAYVDCAEESPKGRRSLCFDQKALNDRKENKPIGSAVEEAKKMGTELLSEEQYRQLQMFGEFDLKTSSWIQTPEAIRKLGGALFCDRRYSRVFTYHNGAISYYAARGFRTILFL